MADVEIIIKIPEVLYWAIKQNVSTDSVYDAVKNGTLLPKGHGKIADIDKMLEEMRATRTYDIPFALERVKPIIYADRKEQE